VTRDARDYLGHVRDACDRVASYTQEMTKQVFLAAPMVQDAVIRQMEIIGEAGKKALDNPGQLDLTTVKNDLTRAYGLRNFLIHGYFGVDAMTVWVSAKKQIPRLRSAVAAILGASQEAPEEAAVTGVVTRG